MISIKHLVKRFNDQVVLNGIDLNIEKGEVVALIGPSGTGKSTLLRSINLLEQPDEGSITIDGNTYDLATISKRDRLVLRRSTAMVFQQFNLFRNRTALENVMEGLRIVKKLPKDDARRLAVEELKKVGMEEFQDHYPIHLSGGQQQRVAIARALSMNPQLLLLDEPTSALDPERVKEVQDTISVAAEEGNTMLLVSHEMGFVHKIASRVIFLDKGSIVEQGDPRSVFSNPQTPRLQEFLSDIETYGLDDRGSAPTSGVHEEPTGQAANNSINFYTKTKTI